MFDFFEENSQFFSQISIIISWIFNTINKIVLGISDNEQFKEFVQNMTDAGKLGSPLAGLFASVLSVKFFDFFRGR